MSSHIEIEVLISYVRVALELFVHTCKDAVKALATILITLFLIT